MCLSPSLGTVRRKSLGSGVQREPSQIKSETKDSPMDPTLTFPSSLDQGGGGMPLILSSESGWKQRGLKEEQEKS